MDNSIIILMLIIILIVAYGGRKINEKMRNAREKYRSCCWHGCQGVCKVYAMQEKDLVFDNPYRRPFSTDIFPERNIYDKQLKIAQFNTLVQ